MPSASAAHTLAREHNSEDVTSGYIYLVDLTSGCITDFIGTYAAKQIEPGDGLYGKYAVIRISHSLLTVKEAQRFIDEKGKGW